MREKILFSSVSYRAHQTLPFQNPQHDLVEHCRDKGILLEAYCPLGSTNSPLLKDEDLLRIAKKNNVTPATILISYQVNRGIVVLPKSVTASRKSCSVVPRKMLTLRSGITENLKTIKLSEEDMKTLNEMAANGKQQRVNTPLFGWDLVRSTPFLLIPYTELRLYRVSTTGTASETRMLRTRRL